MSLFTSNRPSGRLKPDGKFPSRYMSEQRCSTCGLIQGFEEFSRSTGRNLSSSCLTCRSGRAPGTRVAKARIRHQKRVKPDGDFPARYVSEQRCKDCGQIYGFEDFYRNNRRDLTSRCKACHIKITGARWQAVPSERLRTQFLQKLKRYGLTEEEYWGLLEFQHFCCAICEEPESNARALCVDHDHTCCDRDGSCGKCVRGLICDPCNLMLARFRDEARKFQRASDYLLIPPMVTVRSSFVFGVAA
jgi:hypothetical protein